MELMRIWDKNSETVLIPSSMTEATGVSSDLIAELRRESAEDLNLAQSRYEVDAYIVGASTTTVRVAASVEWVALVEHPIQRFGRLPSTVNQRRIGRGGRP